MCQCGLGPPIRIWSMPSWTTAWYLVLSSQCHYHGFLSLRPEAAVDRLVAKATVQHAWSLNNDLLHPPQHRLTLCMPLWSGASRHPFSMVGWLEFGFYGKLWRSARPYCPSSRIWSAKEIVVYSKSRQNKPRTLWRLPQELGPCW